MGSRGVTLLEMMIVVAMIGTLTAIGYPLYETALSKARIAKAIADIRAISNEIGVYQLFNNSPPPSLADVGMAHLLDPYGRPYVYFNFTAAAQGQGGQGQGQGQGGGGGGGGGIAGQARKDRFLVPINSDYDLYSKGQDGNSVAPLTAAQSRDDIIRANDGGFIGLASEY